MTKTSEKSGQNGITRRRNISAAQAPELFMKSPNPSGSPAPASPFPVANSAQAARPGRNTARIAPGHVGSSAESATEKGSGERIRRFMNSSGK